MKPQSLMLTNQRPAQIMLRGEGSWLFDETGDRYLDFVQGWAVNALGHCPTELRDALTEQSATLLTASPAYHNQPAEALAARLVGSSGLASAFLCNSGAEANECASKLARKWGRLHKSGAHEIITTENAFHGRTLAMMTASGKPGWEQMFPPNIEGFRKVPFGSVSAVADAVTERTCAVMVEPIQGEAGVILPSSGYLSGLRELTREKQLLLIFDEIQTGMGRTGSLFRFQHENATPDVLTLGKGLGGGVPLAAVVASQEASCFSPGEHGGTYAGNPLMASCGIAVFDAITRDGFLERVVAAGARLGDGLESLTQGPAPKLLSARGAGLLRAAQLAEPIAQEVSRRAFGLGLLLNAPRPDTLRFMPSLRVSDAEIDLMLERLERALA